MQRAKENLNSVLVKNRKEIAKNRRQWNIMTDDIVVKSDVIVN